LVNKIRFHKDVKEEHFCETLPDDLEQINSCHNKSMVLFPLPSNIWQKKNNIVHQNVKPITRKTRATHQVQKFGTLNKEGIVTYYILHLGKDFQDFSILYTLKTNKTIIFVLNSKLN